MDILNIVIATKKMRLNEIRNVIFENYYKGIGFSLKSTYYSIKYQKKYIQLFATKLAEKSLILVRAKEHYESFKTKKNTKH